MAEQKQNLMVPRRAGPARPGPAMAAPTLTPKDIFGILRRHIWLMVSLIVLGFIVGGASWYFLRQYFPKYTAQTLIKVLPPGEKEPLAIAARLAGKDIQYGHRQSIASLIKEQRSFIRLIDSRTIQETKWFKRFGEPLDRAIQKAFKDLRKHFRAFAHRDADFVVISMTCRDDKESALIVNEMLDLFLASQRGTSKTEITNRLTELENQRLSVQRELDLSNNALDQVRTRFGFTDLEQRYFRPTITRRLGELEVELDRLILEKNQIQTTIDVLEERMKGPVTKMVEREVERDPVVINLTQQLAALEIVLAGRLAKFGENHKVVRQTQQLINSTKQERQIRKVIIAQQTRQSNLQAAEEQLTVWLSSLEELEKRRSEAQAKQSDLELARVQYEQRVVIRDERQKMVDLIKGQIEKLKIMHDDPETPKVMAIGRAPVPLDVSFPRWKLFFSGGTVLGIMLGVGLAFLIEMLNDLVRTPRDVARFLHIPLLGVIPDADEDEQVHGVDLCLVVRQAPYSIISESYRRFRTNLKLSGSAEAARVLLVSSGVAGDGKTPVAVNLATTFVAEDKKVLLVDANFWRPSLHKIFPKPQQTSAQTVEPSGFGLSTLLTGLSGYQEVIRSSGIDSFDIIDSGPLPSNPAELLSGAQMKELVKNQRENYDYVIFDGPPVLLVSDVKVLARLVDGTVLVFNAGTTRRGAALRTIRELREVDATIVGCVVFAVKAMKGGYFREQFKSHQEYQELQLARSI